MQYALALLLLCLTLPAIAQPAAPTPLPPAPPPAATPPVPSLSDLSRSLRNYFTPDESEALYQYMRDAAVAAFKGEEVDLPPDLAFKLEILLARMKKEGGAYMDILSKQLEQDLKKRMDPPPPTEYHPSNPYLPQNNPYLQR